MLVFSEEFLDIQATIECRFTLKRLCDNNIHPISKEKSRKQIEMVKIKAAFLSNVRSNNRA